MTEMVNVIVKKLLIKKLFCFLLKNNFFIILILFQVLENFLEKYSRPVPALTIELSPCR